MKRTCHYCNSEHVMRVRRHRWMHWLPGSKKYVCRSCYGEFFTLLSGITIGLHAGYSRLIKLNQTN
jgi:hypothetical protein